jgi:hypothetical protein
MPTEAVLEGRQADGCFQIESLYWSGTLHRFCAALSNFCGIPPGYSRISAGNEFRAHGEQAKFASQMRGLT